MLKGKNCRESARIAINWLKMKGLQCSNIKGNSKSCLRQIFCGLQNTWLLQAIYLFWGTNSGETCSATLMKERFAVAQTSLL